MKLFCFESRAGRFWIGGFRRGERGGDFGGTSGAGVGGEEAGFVNDTRELFDNEVTVELFRADDTNER